ncbi:MAG: class B sortase [Bacilli bacterium]|nr:class B sortase [Bacilli bacterium]
MKKIIKYTIATLSITIIILFLQNNDKVEKKKTLSNGKKSEDLVTVLRKQYNNNDIIGTIEIPGTEINENILQTSDNEYYLSHDNYGNNDIYGSVFLDYRCHKDSKKLLIFGHNDYKDATPFSNLENYYDRSYYENNKYIDVMIDNEKMKYQIFSVYIEPEDFTYMNLKITDEQYKNDLIKYKNKSLYDTNVEVSENDKILILQTCSNHKDFKKYKDKYLLIIAKKLNS